MISLTKIPVVVVACCFIPFLSISKSTLPPQIVQPPLFSCATTVSVSGFVPGARIDIYVGGTTRIGGGVSDSPWGQVFSVSPALSDGQVVTATQTVGSDTSDPSPTVTV